MPTYNYRCDSCNNQFSIRQSIKDDSIIECKNCNGTVKRIISGNMGLIFKGSGFYLTDYKNNQKSAEEDSKSPLNKENNSKPVEKEKNKTEVSNSPQKKENKADE